MKNIAVIRALDLRIIQAEYASCFNRLKPFYVSNYNKEIGDYLKGKSAEYISLGMTPSHIFDPVKHLFGTTTHQSWLVFEKKELETRLNNIDIYQIQEPFFLYSGQVSEIAKKFKKPLVMTPFMCFNHPSTYLPPYSSSVRKSIAQTDLFIMRTNKVGDYLSGFKIPDKKKVLIYHGVNLKRFFPGDRQKEKVRILFVGQLDRSKGLNDILEIFPKLVKESGGKVELVVCGSGILSERVKELSKQFPIKHMGQVSNLNLPEVYRSCDVFCGPGKDQSFLGVKKWEENFGFVFAEAMASGLPIVTNNCGAIKEVVGEKNIINKQGDKNTLIKSLLELIGDENARREIGISNRMRAEKYFDLKKQVIQEEREIIKRFC